MAEVTLADALGLGIPAEGLGDAPVLLPQDEPLDIADEEVLACYREYLAEAEQAKRPRMKRNEYNRDVYLGLYRNPRKRKGQSDEILPKLALAVEQFVAFVKRAMTDYGDFFQLELGVNDLELPVEGLQRWLRSKLETLSYAYPSATNFPTVVADALKVGATESLMIVKVHGRINMHERFGVERGMVETPDGAFPVERLTQSVFPRWDMCMDVVDPNDWYPDPTGEHLYVIHKTRQGMHRLHEMVDAGEYDADVVSQISAATRVQDTERRSERHKGQAEVTGGNRRREVEVAELWGTLLDQDGAVIAENIVTTIVNDQYIVRKPTKNPYWHGQPPFVSAALVRVPFSTWHRALFDFAADLNVALNEIANLMLDGGIASVWGIRQIRTEWLEDPKQASQGVPQGVTLKIKADVPVGGKAMETVTSGDVPGDAFNIFGMFDQEFNVSAMTSELKLGAFPKKQALATEIIEASQGQAGTIDGVVRDIEDTFMEKVLRFAWLTCLQFTEDFTDPATVEVLGERAALLLAQMTPAQRFAAFAEGSVFRVNGLSAVLARARDFQKLSALMQMMLQNETLGQAFLQRFDIQKFIARLLRSINIDPESMEVQQKEAQPGAQGPPPGGGGAGESLPPTAAPPSLEEILARGESEGPTGQVEGPEAPESAIQAGAVGGLDVSGGVV